MISLQWWIENLHRTTSLFEAHPLTFHFASLLWTVFLLISSIMTGPSFLTQVGQMCLHRSENWRQRQTDTQVHWETGIKNEMKEKKTSKESPQPVLHAEPVSRAPQSITKGPWPMPDVDRPAELWNGVVDADTKDGSSTYPTSSTVRHLPIIASGRPRKRRTPWPSCAFNSTASSSKNRKYPRSNGC